MPKEEGKDVTFMITGDVDPTRYRRQRPSPGTAQPATFSGQAYNTESTVVNAPLRNGQWRTQFKRAGHPLKTTYSKERPEIHSSNGVVHIHTERFDVITRFNDVELLECEYGELEEPEPIDTENDVDYTDEDGVEYDSGE